MIEFAVFAAIFYFVATTQGQFLYPIYEKFCMYRPKWLLKPLGGCALCTLFWMNVVYCGVGYFLGEELTVFSPFMGTGISIFIYNQITEE